MMSFDEIYLRSEELRLLKRISRKPIPEDRINRRIFQRLAHHHFTMIEPGSGSLVSASDTGLDYLAYVSARRREQAVAHWWDLVFLLLGAALGYFLKG